MHLYPFLRYNKVTTTQKGGKQIQMQTNLITKILGIQAVKVIDYCEDVNGALILNIQSTRKSLKCPMCGKRTSKIHDKRIQKVKDISFCGKTTYLSVLKRRFRCSCGKRFTEQIQYIPKHHQITSRISMQIIKDLKQIASMQSIAKKNNVSVTTVKRIQNMIYHTNKPSLPKVLSIDEFKGNTNGVKYHCAIVNIEEKKLLDIIEDRRKSSLETYFSRYTKEERKKVEYFVCDMWQPYVEIAKKYFPNSKIIIDKYHYSRMVYWALDSVRKRIQKSLDKKYKKVFFNCRRILMKHGENLTKEQKEKLDIMFWYSPELLQAYTLKEMYVKLSSLDNPNEKSMALEQWIELAKNSKISEFERYAKSFINWKEEIVNSFTHNYTNGCIEGINNLIKVIKRISFGYRNFKSFRTRILHIKG